MQHAGASDDEGGGTQADFVVLRHLPDGGECALHDAHQAFVDLVVESAKKGDKVSWPGFGSFSTSKRQARTGRNPRTGEPVQIAASTAMKFSPSSTLKAELNPNR